ncbi:uncharacterized protein VNE69_07099 [Vairimorpha necatrix]|uniref:Uncharacterized protein n=1 Tax=Vairimorpha necatrix TaxID=6039 RepID=A0AAX4JDJ1_9MICR
MIFLLDFIFCSQLNTYENVENYVHQDIYNAYKFPRTPKGITGYSPYNELEQKNFRVDLMNIESTCDFYCNKEHIDDNTTNGSISNLNKSFHNHDYLEKEYDLYMQCDYWRRNPDDNGIELLENPITARHKNFQDESLPIKYINSPEQNMNTYLSKSKTSSFLDSCKNFQDESLLFKHNNSSDPNVETCLSETRTSYIAGISNDLQIVPFPLNYNIGSEQNIETFLSETRTSFSPDSYNDINDDFDIYFLSKDDDQNLPIDDITLERETLATNSFFPNADSVICDEKNESEPRTNLDISESKTKFKSAINDTKSHSNCRITQNWELYRRPTYDQSLNFDEIRKNITECYNQMTFFAQNLKKKFQKKNDKCTSNKKYFKRDKNTGKYYKEIRTLKSNSLHKLFDIHLPRIKNEISETTVDCKIKILILDFIKLIEFLASIFNEKIKTHRRKKITNIQLIKVHNHNKELYLILEKIPIIVTTEKLIDKLKSYYFGNSYSRKTVFQNIEIIRTSLMKLLDNSNKIIVKYEELNRYILR